MPWGAAIGAIGTIGAAAVSSDKNGGAGSSSTDKSPWFAAQPWLVNNLVTGQNLQNAYLAQPQSAQQQAAVNNIYGESDYVRSLVPSLLGQLQNQSVGYDPSNPSARPKAWDWSGLTGAAPGSGAGTGTTGPNLGQSSVANAGLLTNSGSPTVAPPAPPPVAANGLFTNQSGNAGDMDYTRLAMTGKYGSPEDATQGGYGSFKYGQQPSTPQEISDARQYLAMGGADPYGMLQVLKNGGSPPQDASYWSYNVPSSNQQS